MRKIKTHIKTSADGNLTYKLYRDIDEVQLPASSDVLSILQPIAIIKEADIIKKAFLVSEEEAAVDVTSIITLSYVPYSIKSKMIKDMAHDLIVKITYNDGTSKIFTIKFDNYENAISIIDNLGANYDLSSTFDLSNKSLIKINESIITDAVLVKVSYYTEVIEILDSKEHQQGVDYIGPAPTGNIEVKLNKAISQYADGNFIIPYVDLTPTTKSSAQTYCYRIVAVDLANNISDPSDLVKINLQQPLAELSYKVQYCTDTTALNPVWIDMPYPVTNGVSIQYGKFDSPDFLTNGNIFKNATVTPIDESTMDAIYSSVNSSIDLTFENPWFITKYKSKESKAFRLQALLDATGTVTVNSPIIGHEALTLDIDYLEVRRCEINSPNDPFDLSNNDLLARFCLNKGKTYNQLKASADPDLADSELNSALTIYNGNPIVKWIPMDSGFSIDKLTITDNQVVSGKQYKYAILLKDGLDNQSDYSYKYALIP